MTHVSPRRSMVLALLATTAASCLLGACNQTGGLFSRNSGPAEVQMSAGEAARATSQWAAAYAKNPQDPEMALGYAKTLRAIGSKERSLEILKTAYRANPNEGEVAAELGRVALEMGRVDIASHALKSAETQGVTDWKTLSAQGTLHAKKGEHSEAQQYFLAALEKKPDSTSVINNLALSYALDGKPAESEALLRKAADNGQDDKRIRQNLALVLGVQGKFDEARQVAAVDMTEAQAKSSLSYLQDMLVKPTQVASAEPSAPRKAQVAAEDWSPFGYDEPEAAPEPIRTASNTTPAITPPKVQVVTPVDEIEAPGKLPQKSAEPAAPAAAPAVTTVVAQATQAMPAPPPVRTKVIHVPETPETPVAAPIAAPITTSVAPSKAKVARAEVVLPIAPPAAAKTDKSTGVPTEITPASLLRADLD